MNQELSPVEKIYAFLLQEKEGEVSEASVREAFAEVEVQDLFSLALVLRDAGGLNYTDNQFRLADIFNALLKGYRVVVSLRPQALRGAGFIDEEPERFYGIVEEISSKRVVIRIPSGKVFSIPVRMFAEFVNFMEGILVLKGFVGDAEVCCV